jgi:hypothetical protein
MKKSQYLGIYFLLLSTYIAAAADPYNYAANWKLWNIQTREAYIDGLVDGVAEAYRVTSTNMAADKLLKNPEPPELKKTRDRLFVRYTRDQVRDVITDLYKDPSNAFISTSEMFFLARDRIEGKDVSGAIMEARKQALDNHTLNEKMKRQ